MTSVLVYLGMHKFECDKCNFVPIYHHNIDTRRKSIAHEEGRIRIFVSGKVFLLTPLEGEVRIISDGKEGVLLRIGGDEPSLSLF